MAYKLITALRYEEQLDSILHYVAEELESTGDSPNPFVRIGSIYFLLKSNFFEMPCKITFVCIGF